MSLSNPKPTAGEGEWVVITRGPHKNRLAKVKERTSELYYLFLSSASEAALFPLREVRPATYEEVEQAMATRRHASYGSVKKTNGDRLYRELDPIKEKTEMERLMAAWSQMMTVQGQFVADMGKRVDDLLKSNNELLERARKAEARADKAEAELQQMHREMLGYASLMEGAESGK
jgi:hypothetical protein